MNIQLSHNGIAVKVNDAGKFEARVGNATITAPSFEALKKKLKVPVLVHFAPDSERTWFTTLREKMMSVSNVLFLLALQHRGDKALSKRLNELAEELK